MSIAKIYFIKNNRCVKKISEYNFEFIQSENMIRQRVLEGSYQVMIVIGKCNGIFIAIFKANRLALIYSYLRKNFLDLAHVFGHFFIIGSYCNYSRKETSF